MDWNISVPQHFLNVYFILFWLDCGELHPKL